MHYSDYLSSNAAEDTGRIHSALVSRKVAFSILERRYSVLEALSFWVGGFLFYITYWTALISVNMAARMLEVLFNERHDIVHAATDW